MSRSFRRSPYVAWCGSDSDKVWKRLWHKRMRAAIVVAVHRFDADKDFLPHENRVGNPWCSSKDGRLCFDPREHPELMRK